ncbi:putative quinol monooxygenase [Pseudoalteromonas aurantia]|uniref:ABM domain-containing protein n=1 Tax=Pseudoalteromonas aurantia 208 TaxID=1314867 RepID=A0ABR9EBM4_9GAMM|nr:antibiotic biosynthesis monooxygenase [Pseudoalteromonas aurantia]MBE0368400.1 hypothetical protein [Pseudoalteromonas aurantia 208]
MSITVILEAKVKQRNKEKFLQLLTEYLPDTHKFSGFIDISIYSEVDTELIIFISKWQSLKVYQRYLDWRIDTGVMTTLEALMIDPPVIRQLTKEISDNLVLMYV